MGVARFFCSFSSAPSASTRESTAAVGAKARLMALQLVLALLGTWLSAPLTGLAAWVLSIQAVLHASENRASMATRQDRLKRESALIFGNPPLAVNPSRHLKLRRVGRLEDPESAGPRPLAFCEGVLRN